MKHFGDITKINGHEVPLVDIVTGGSPCQDLSVAGKRAGLEGERSGLFMEQIRIIKEMRDESRKRADGYIRPRFMVWENVPGALSSNNGEDFRIVLEETVRIVEPTAVIPRYEGGWTNCGVILGREWSLAWKIHDLQFWGCPQRRRRISLVADFGGQSAPEILFERKSLSGNPESSEEEREGTAEVIRGDSDSTISFQERAGCDGGVKASSSNTIGQEHSPQSTINPSCNQGESVVYGISSDGSNAMLSDNPHSGIYEAKTTRTLDLNGGNPNCNQGGMIVLEGNGSRDSHKGDGFKVSDTMFTLNTVEQHGVCYSQDAYDEYSENDNSASLKAQGGSYGGGSESLVVSKDSGSSLCER